MSVVAPPPQDELDLLIKEARARQRRRMVIAAATVAVLAGACLAVWAAVPSGGVSLVHRYRGPIDAAAKNEIAATGPHLGISNVGTSGGVTWASNSYYNPRAFWLTNNNGRSWHRLRLPEHAYAVNPRASFGDIEFVDRQHGWVGYGNRVYRTVDGGRIWQLSASGLRCLAPRCGGVENISFSDSQHGLAFLAVLSPGNHELFRTSDGGRTWQLQSRPPFIGQMTAPNGRDGLMAVQGPGPLGLYFGPPVGALFRTTDGGTTWSKYNIAGSKSWLELPMGVFGHRVVVVQNAPNHDGGINELPGTVWSSADDGSHWDGAAVPHIGVPSSFSLASPRFWAFAAERGDDLYITSTAGHNWRKIHLRIPRGRPNDMVLTRIGGLAFTSPRLGWAIVHAKLPGVIGNETLIRTTDGGLHWTVSGPVGHPRHRRS
jgi:photosystem II stability/assembly factor-like uncharacterized protein